MITIESDDGDKQEGCDCEEREYKSRSVHVMLSVDEIAQMRHNTQHRPDESYSLQSSSVHDSDTSS